MADTIKARVGFVSGGHSSMPHYSSFLPLVPSEIKLEQEGLDLYRESLYQIADKKEQIVHRVQEFVTKKNWDGVILTAAPTEVLNPGLFDDLKATLSVPFTTALHACVAALSVYSAKRVLLLTPFDEKLNDLMTKQSLNAADPVDAIYFRGAVLDPIKVLEKIETELGMLTIASNPAMLWYVLSKLRFNYPMSGYGRLLREWPKLIE